MAFQLNEEFERKHSLWLETFIFEESRSLYIVKHNIQSMFFGNILGVQQFFE